MRLRFLLVLTTLFFVACSGEPVADKNPDADSQDANANVTTELSEADKKAKAESEANAAAAKAEEESKSQMETLAEEFKASNAKWIQEMRALATSEERNAHSKNHPRAAHAEKLVALAEKYPATKAAPEAWKLACKLGSGETKKKAIGKLLDSTLGAKDSARTEGLEFLMLYADGEEQTQATNLLLADAEKEIDSDESFEIIKKVATAPRMKTESRDGSVMMPIDSEVREKAVRQLKLFVQQDIKSEKAVECLELMYNNGSDKDKDMAMQQLLDHHISHDRMIGITSRLSRDVTQRNEMLLKEIIQKSTGKANANAIITLAKFHSMREREATYYASAPPEHLVGVSKERLEYLNSELAEVELANLEKLLETYVNDHSENLVAAKRELFALQKLAVGKTAPDIIGNDLDGNEFKLSDYRGKVVFLDFWGDW